ncbi:MAG: HEPN domain-containing protein [Candidatus Thermoplasmatota archaeon]|nr:HEPN domain-containing protein [Candidatus Thermoplasmatota archaeon]
MGPGRYQGGGGDRALNTLDIALLALKRSERWIESAKRGLSDSRWDDAVYSAQMCSEHAAKAVLISLGIDFPRQHDVSDVFVTLKDRRDLPSDFRGKVEDMVEKLASLAAERALAGYGFEGGIGVEYFEKVAPDAIEDAEFILQHCRKFVIEVFGVEKELS